MQCPLGALAKAGLQSPGMRQQLREDRGAPSGKERFPVAPEAIEQVLTLYPQARDRSLRRGEGEPRLRVRRGEYSGHCSSHPSSSLGPALDELWRIVRGGVPSGRCRLRSGVLTMTRRSVSTEIP